MYDILLKHLEQRKEPIDVIVVGVGFMGFGFLSFLQKMKGIRIPLVISRRPVETRLLLKNSGITVVSEDIQSTSQIRAYADKGYICVSDNLTLIKKYEDAIVLEMTGTIDYGTEAALIALKSKKHVVTMNPELQVTVGSELKVIADAHNVTITDVYGDQPGSLARLIGNAKMMGFKVLVAGNMKRYRDNYATQEKMRPWAKDKGLAVRQTVSFTDGTKQAIEMNLVAGDNTPLEENSSMPTANGQLALSPGKNTFLKVDAIYKNANEEEIDALIRKINSHEAYFLVNGEITYTGDGMFSFFKYRKNFSEKVMKNDSIILFNTD